MGLYAPNIINFAKLITISISNISFAEKELFVMIKIYNPQGKVLLTNDFFAGLVGNAITSCYGVAGMSVAGAKDGMRAVFFGSDIPEKGVVVREDDGQLVIDLHIKVIYGVNIATIVENIKERVSYAVEHTTNLKVKSINVSVDDIITE